ncbi:hypothetical protein COCON_G00235140 [Conger conger]|uniref:Ig-like domain-containing protein n=1 Tax=Conger conger TaxID=82655 RepID=A0A9Q1HM77_CONCO|nr:hypothetical protein COCON_G00235140 [Conger conger]
MLHSSRFQLKSYCCSEFQKCSNAAVISGGCQVRLGEYDAYNEKSYICPAPVNSSPATGPSCTSTDYEFASSLAIPAAEISVPVVAAPGSDITLSCSFPRSETDLLFNLIVVWEHGDEVVHSYDKATGHLEEQSPAYRGRTQLSPDQLAVGDASLRLTGVRASDHGKYTCYVGNEQGWKSKKKIFLVVAAADDQPDHL